MKTHLLRPLFFLVMGAALITGVVAMILSPVAFAALAPTSGSGHAITLLLAAALVLAIAIITSLRSMRDKSSTGHQRDVGHQPAAPERMTFAEAVDRIVTTVSHIAARLIGLLTSPRATTGHGHLLA